MNAKQLSEMERVRSLLVGRTVTDIEWDTYSWDIHLDDGTYLNTWDIGCAVYKGTETLAELVFEE